MKTIIDYTKPLEAYAFGNFYSSKYVKFLPEEETNKPEFPYVVEVNGVKKWFNEYGENHFCKGIYILNRVVINWTQPLEFVANDGKTHRCELLDHAMNNYVLKAYDFDGGHGGYGIFNQYGDPIDNFSKGYIRNVSSGVDWSKGLWIEIDGQILRDSQVEYIGESEMFDKYKHIIVFSFKPNDVKIIARINDYGLMYASGIRTYKVTNGV